MNFNIMKADPFETVKLQINSLSCAFWINEKGLMINGTLNPQSGIDYIQCKSGSPVLDRNYLKVIGVDLI